MGGLVGRDIISNVKHVLFFLTLFTIQLGRRFGGQTTSIPSRQSFRANLDDVVVMVRVWSVIAVSMEGLTGPVYVFNHEKSNVNSFDSVRKTGLPD